MLTRVLRQFEHLIQVTTMQLTHSQHTLSSVTMEQSSVVFQRYHMKSNL